MILDLGLCELHAKPNSPVMLKPGLPLLETIWPMPCARFGWTLGITGQGRVLVHPGFSKGKLELTVATMLWDQTSYLSADESSQGGPALRASPGAQAEHLFLLYPFVAHVSSHYRR